MSVLPVLTYPHTFLKTKCVEAEFSDPTLAILIRDMRETMDAHPGCVGLAASQVSKLVRVLLVDASRSKRENENHGFLCLINPVILESSQWKVSREGCLSFPNLLANVKRAQKLTIRAFGADKRPFEFTAVGFEAVAIQHEMDHLDGIVFLDRIRSSKDLVERRVLV
jgi:peptide deformylase